MGQLRSPGAARSDVDTFAPPLGAHEARSSGRLRQLVGGGEAFWQPRSRRDSVAAARSRLAFTSLLMLFVELALIRWTAANDVYLATVTNYVLLASFLGIGLGFLLAGRSPDLFRFVPVALAALVVFVLAFPVRLSSLHGPHIFSGLAGLRPLPEWLVLGLLFLLVVFVMAGLGQGVARNFAALPALDAYRADIAGSLAGIVLFSLLALAGTPPIVWGALTVAALVALLGRRPRWWQLGALAVVVVLLVIESVSSFDAWSPYYKITAVPSPSGRSLSVTANDVPYQTVAPVAVLRRSSPFYFFPYRHTTAANLSNVLIIGAGTGNDVGVALAEGARHVTAVELDPELVSLGRRYNPERAYENPRVTVHVDDGRAFLEDSTQRYSLILLDAMSALGGQAAPVGLANYLLTLDAARAARAHLAPGGVFAMYNYYTASVTQRYATQLSEVFGRPPCDEVGSTLGNRQQVVLTESPSGAVRACAHLWSGRPVPVATDDHPYPYLPTPSIPAVYLEVIAFVVAASLLAVRACAGRFSEMGIFVDLFFMGAAFMLLETKNIVQFALLFGTTWYVNSLVFAGVLLSVYLAIELARHVRLPHPTLLYGALLVGLAVTWVVPQDWLLTLPLVPRFLGSTALAFAPVFVANLVFAQRFRDVSSSTTAFGANLLGALCGGLLEYLSMVTGFRFLLIVAAALYGLAFLSGRRHLVPASRVPVGG
jgi:hypothetical protein